MPVSNISNYSLLIVALLLSACKGSGSVDALLRQAEDSVMVNAAYTAAMLDTLSEARLTTASQRALYGLLLTQSHTRLHDSIPSDSLISASVSYYEDHGSDRRLMLALYYLGKTRLDHGEYAQALVPLLRSYEMATAANNQYLAGMTACALSDLYNDTYNRKEELEMAILESEAFRREGDPLFIAYAELDRARALSNSFRFDEAIALSDTVLLLAEQIEDPDLYTQVLRICGLTYLTQEKWAEAAESYDAFVGSDYFTNQDSIFLVYSILLSGDKKRGLELYRQLTLPDDIYAWNLKYNVYKALGQYDSALMAYEKADSFTNHFVDLMLTRNIAGELQLYQQTSSKDYGRKLRRAHLNVLYVVIGCIVICIAIGLMIGYIARRRREEIRNQLDNANALIAELHKASAETRTTMASDSNIHSHMSIVMQQYYSFFNSLILAAVPEDKNSSKRQLAKIHTAIDELVSSEKRFNELIAQLNIPTDNLIARFQTSLPGLPSKDYRLFVFSLLNFSNESLTVLLQETNIRSVYERKRRLKKKIEELPEPDRSDFLAVL